MAGPAPTQPRKVQPPRPPNAWILYRSCKFAAMRAGLEGPVTQGNLSRKIAEMWRKEPEHVRRYWERAAEDEKTKHSLLYPDYRYCPRRKEDKEREKQARKQTRRKIIRARAATPASDSNASPTDLSPSASASPPAPQLPADAAMDARPSAPHANQHYLAWLESRYGPCGPSPPMSAAPSPIPSPDPRAHTVPPSTSPSALPSPGSDLQDASSSTQPPFYQPNSQHSSPNAFATHPLPAFPFQPSLHVVAPAPVAWNNVHNQHLTFDPQSLDAVNFDIPFNHGQTFAGFQQDVPDQLSFDSLPGLLAGSDSNGIWDLPDAHSKDLVSQPHGSLDVGVGCQAPTVDYNNQLFADFDYATFEQQIASLAAGDSTSIPTAPLSQEDIQSLFCTPDNPEVQAYMDTRHCQSSVLTQDLARLMEVEAAKLANTEAASSSATLLPMPTTIAPHQVGFQNTEHAAEMPIFTQMTNTSAIPPSSSYVPPPGAIYSSTRRVAATWKPPLATPLHIEEPTDVWSSLYTN